MNFSVYAQTKIWAETSRLQLHAMSRVGSTNDWAKTEALQINREDIHLYLADYQTAGRGRGDNSWHDGGTGTSLLATWSLALTFEPQPILSPALGLALYRAMIATWPDLALSVKPPNDLFCQEKKVAGLLIETVQQGNNIRLLLGLGLNVFAKPNTVDAPLAASLSEFLAPDRLTPEIWNGFLDRLLLEIVATLQESPMKLTANQCAGLRFAINKMPHLKTPIQEVTTDGSLVLQDGNRLTWRSI